MSSTVLMVAEKPSLALSIAKILSDNRLSSRKSSKSSALSVHEWQGSFERQKTANFRMTSVCGHVFSLDFPAKYNDWNRVDPSELFNCDVEHKEADAKLRIPSALAVEGRGADALVLWLDCDKEGENICFEVINVVLPVAKRNVRVLRAKFSSITAKDIKQAMANLGTPDENQSRSVDARQELDLRIGCAFTRFQTRFFQGKYGDLDSSLISYGPCQTPTLGFCVDRHDRIQAFKPEPFWVIQASIRVSESRSLSLQWSRGRCFDQEVAHLFLNQAKISPKAVITAVSVKDKAKERPTALNTVELMRVASAGLNMGPHHAMQIAERLYTQGFISYPRTESTQYAPNFDLRDTLRTITKGSSEYSKEINDLFDKGVNKPRKGHDAGDHPPITPMRSATRDQLDGDSWRLYDYVVRHFIATVSYNLKYESTTISFEVGKEDFTFVGTRVTDKGYTAIMPWLNKQSSSVDEDTNDEDDKEDNLDDTLLPSNINLQKGTTFDLGELKLSERHTSPPDYLTEADLITLMERHGIGTDASIPVHINNICQRNYVNVSSSSRKLVPTMLGIVLVHGYLAIDPDLVRPQMRSAVEKQLDLIAHGKADFDAVLKHTLEVFRLKFHYFVKQISGMDQLFEVSFSSLADTGKPFSRCGKCRRFMKLIQAKPVRLYCKHCDEALNLPSQGQIRLHQELKCPLDDYEILYCFNGVKGKGFVFCPFCINHPPFDSMTKASTCTNCTHPTCPHSLNQLGISSCPDCSSGVLVLDEASAPKWKLACNACNVIIRCFDDASRVNVLPDRSCEKCDATLLKVQYKEITKSKLKDGETVAEGCIYCDEDLSGLVEKHEAVFLRRRRNQTSNGRGRGKGRGRGRPKPPKDKMSKLAAYFV